MSCYYPGDYYSFQEATPRPAGWLERRARRLRTALIVRREGVAGRLVRWIKPSYSLELLSGYARTDSRILDYGCGRGGLLLNLQLNGFTRLLGYDPFIGVETINHGNGVVVYRTLPPDYGSIFDIVILDHVFEHLPNPMHALDEIAALLAPRGILIIRTPLAGSYAWRAYRTNWVQLDAPRHLFLQTPESLELLARSHNFRIHEIRYDSTGFQFYGSEQYRRDIPLRDARSHWVNPHGSTFSSDEMEEFEKTRAELNRVGDGDQATFILGMGA